MRWARCRCGSDAAAGIHSITRIAEYRGNPNLRTEFGCAAPISPARTQHNHRPSLTIPWPEYVSSQQPSSWAYTCSSYSLKPYRSVTACGCVQRACYTAAAAAQHRPAPLLTQQRMPSPALASSLFLLLLPLVVQSQQPNPGDTCKATEYCCPDAKHCLTPVPNKTCGSTKCAATETCCPLTKICVTVGAACTSPCADQGSYCCPDAKHCLTPVNPGHLCDPANKTACGATGNVCWSVHINFPSVALPSVCLITPSRSHPSV
jgi:hypothetical protein